MTANAEAFNLEGAFQAFEFGQLYARSSDPEAVRRDFLAAFGNPPDLEIQCAFDEGVAFERALPSIARKYRPRLEK